MSVTRFALTAIEVAPVVAVEPTLASRIHSGTAADTLCCPASLRNCATVTVARCC